MSVSRWRLLGMSTACLMLCIGASLTATATQEATTSAPPRALLHPVEARNALLTLLEKRGVEERLELGLPQLRTGAPLPQLRLDRRDATFSIQAGTKDWPRTVYGVFEVRNGRCQARITHEEWALPHHH